MIKYSFIFLLPFLLFSCTEKQKQEVLKKENKKPLLSVSKKHRAIIPAKAVFIKELGDWKEYRNLKNFMVQFQQITPNEALSNALELKDLTKSLKDSLHPKILDNKAFKAREDVLYNETLRLADMTHIPAIKAAEINKQVDQILEVYNALNTKINTIFIQKSFEDNLNFDEVYIGIDTTKIDSTSKVYLDKMKPKEIKPQKKKRLVTKKAFNLLNPKKKRLLKRQKKE